MFSSASGVFVCVCLSPSVCVCIFWAFFFLFFYFFSLVLCTFVCYLWGLCVSVTVPVCVVVFVCMGASFGFFFVCLICALQMAVLKTTVLAGHLSLVSSCSPIPGCFSEPLIVVLVHDTGFFCPFWPGHAKGSIITD